MANDHNHSHGSDSLWETLGTEAKANVARALNNNQAVDERDLDRAWKADMISRLNYVATRIDALHSCLDRRIPNKPTSSSGGPLAPYSGRAKATVGSVGAGVLGLIGWVLVQLFS